MRKIRASEPRVWKISRNILGVVLAMMVAGLLFLYARMAQQTMYAESSQYLNEVSLQMAAAIEKHCSSQWTMLDMFYRYLMDMSGGDLEKFQDYAVREQPDWGFETLCLIDENSQYYDRTHTYSLLTYKDVTGRLLTEHNKAIVDNVIYEDENRLIFFMPIEELKINGKEMKAIGVSYDTDKLFRVLQIGAFQGQSNLYVIHEDGTEVFSAVNSEGVKGYNLLNSLEKLTFKNGSPEEFRRGLESGSREDNLMTVEFEGKDYYINHTPITGENWILVSMIPVEAVSGKMEQYSYHAFFLMAGVCALIIIGFVIFYSDAAKQILRAEEKARKAAESANEAKTNFFTSMSHDIRTPMNAIIGMTEIAVNHLDDPNKTMNCLGQIRRSGKLLVGLVNDILDMAKIESGKMEIHAERTSLAELIENIVVVITPLVKEKNQDFQICIREVCHEHLMLDSVRMNQVLMNLISNAIKFTPEGGSIRVTVEESLSPHPGQAHFTFTVSDTGMGMSREFQNNIFTAFVRERDSRVDHIEGSGLGMAITGMIVANMGGSICVESEPGMGSIFTVELDFCRAEPEMDSESEEIAISSVKCLLVEADPEICECVCEFMNGLGLVPSTAGSGLEAVELMRTAREKGEDYQLVILDRGLAVYDACEAVRRLKELAGERKLTIFLAAYDWADMETKASEAGVDGFVRKPIFKSTLEQIVRQYVLHTEAVRRPECAETPILAGKRILLVEDNLINQEIVKELLEQTGAAVDAAYNGREGADRYASMEDGYYDLILMDIQMPVMNGYEATRLIRGMNRRDAGSIPIFAMTADAFAEDIAMARQAGMDRHLSKPIDAVSLMQEITRVLI